MLVAFRLPGQHFSQSVSAFMTWQTSSTNMYKSGQQPAAKLVGTTSFVCTTACASVRKKAVLYFFTQHQGLNWEILTNTKCCPQSKSDCGPLLLKGLTGEAIILHGKALTGKCNSVCNSVSTLRHSGQPVQPLTLNYHSPGSTQAAPFTWPLYHPVPPLIHSALSLGCITHVTGGFSLKTLSNCYRILIVPGAVRSMLHVFKNSLGDRRGGGTEFSVCQHNMSDLERGPKFMITMTGQILLLALYTLTI